MQRNRCLSTPDRIRTYNFLIRSEVLYPVEPRVHIKSELLQARKFTVYLNSIQNKKGSISSPFYTLLSNKLHFINTALIVLVLFPETSLT